MAEPSGSGSVHFFQGSSNLQFNNPQFHTTIHGPTGAQANSFEIERILDAEVAPNAILNAGGRADEVRCFPGTREEVIAKAERWMTFGYCEDRRVFWLSGPAGAGKSAIVQTLAERCIKRRALMANFFFFRADRSRNHSRSVVATLLHQLMELLPRLVPIINNIIARNRLVFQKPLRDQLILLVDGPIRSIRGGLLDQTPIVILIDGLDECDSRKDLDNATRAEQAKLLDALHNLVMRPGSSFVVLVASRVEPHIVMGFNSIGCHHGSIYLDGDYRPERDIELFVTAELSKIKHTHSLGRLLDASWPSDFMVNAIVDRSSGQFIYAATVLRFISNSSESPDFTMELVLKTRPSQDHSPFAEIDAIYTFILSRCKYWERASEIIAVHAMPGKYGYYFPPGLLGYSIHESSSFFSSLTSIIKAKISDDDIDLTFYHASFNDFIYSPERAGRFHINLRSYANSLAPRIILAISDHNTFCAALDVLKKVDQSNKPALTDALTQLHAKPEDVHWEDYRWDVKNYFLAPVKELYAKHDPDLYRQIFRHMKEQDWIPANVYLSPTLSLLNLDLQNIQNPRNQAWVQQLFR